MHRRTPFPALIAAATISALALGGCTAGEDRPTGAAGSGSNSQDVAYLWAVGAADASLVTSGDTSFLELRGVESAITRFSDRPHREASEVDLRDFLARWDGRFAEVPPNAVLSYETEPDTAPVQVVVEISRPRFDEATSTIVFAAERIGLAADKLEGADHPVQEHDEIVVPAHTGPVSVFIDSEGPDVSKGQIAAIDTATASSSQAIVDLEAALTQVQNERTGALDAQLERLLTSMTAKNHGMGELNSAYAAINAALRDSDDLDPTSLAAVTPYDIGVPQPVTVARLKTIAAELKSEIDAMSTSQQMEMLRLQSLVTARDEAYETMSALMKRIQDNNAAILRNL